MHRFVLSCHPATACPDVTGLAVSVSVGRDGALILRYLLTGRIEGLRLPDPRSPGPADGLWQTTCFEVFLAADDAHYREFNFSPSGQWAAYAFSGYRVRDDAFRPAADPGFTAHRYPEHLELEARLSPELLPQGERLQMAPCAVIQARDGTLSYWALSHPSWKPDFHLREGFVHLPPAAHSFEPPP